ncbi:MAG: diaminopropionate ammonia-lyase [Chloroflexota bacterium]|nr:diaminopropionate ammonia-lyase [Chloroflexota bacterium]
MPTPQHERWLVRPEARSWRCEPVSHDAFAFHAGLPGYAPTPLVEIPILAHELGVGRVFVKDESSRLGLPAFKILGVSWAVYRAVSRRAGRDIPPTLDDVRAAIAGLGPTELVTATDGNHGRALARIATLVGATAHVFVPESLPTRVIAAISDEGATVIRIGGSYDDAVRLAADRAEASPDRMLIQDTAWPGYEEVPSLTVEGYSTLFHEADAQLRDAGVDSADLVAVPTGVGSLLQSTLAHYRRNSLNPAPSVLSVEPVPAACVLASVRSGALTLIPTGATIMAGLNCGLPSSLAWPSIEQGLDAAVAVSDDEARRAMTDLHRLGVLAGPSGAASLAGVRVVLTRPGRRAALEVDSRSVLLLISTEGIASGAA